MIPGPVGHPTKREQRDADGPMQAGHREFSGDPPLASRAAARPSVAAWGAVAATLLALTLAAAWLRWPSADPTTLFIDEPLTWNVVRNSAISDYITWQHHFEHPPLSFLLSEVSIRLLGANADDGAASLRALRMPAFVAGVLCVPAAFLVGWLLAGPRMGIIVALLAAVDPIQVEQSRVARMYPLFVLTLLLSAAAFIWLLQQWRAARPISPWAWVLAGVLLGAQWWSAGIGFATVAGFLATLAGIVGYTGLALGERRRAARLASGVLLAVFVAALLTHVGLLTRMREGLHDFVDVPRTAPDRAAMMARGMASLANVGIVAAAPAWLVAAGGYVLLVRRARPNGATLLASAAVVNLLALFVALRTYHSLSPRYLIALAPVLWLGWAAWPALAPARWLRWGGAAVVAAVVVTWVVRDLRLGDAAGTDVRHTYAASILAISPEKPVVYLPGYMALSGEMLGRPGNPALQAWVDARGRNPRDPTPPPVPADDELIVWQLGSSRPDVREAYFRTLETLSDAYSAGPVERAKFEPLLGESAPLVVRLTRGRLEPLPAAAPPARAPELR